MPGWFERLGIAASRRLARFLTARQDGLSAAPPTASALLARHLRPGDVLLVEGRTRISTAIKYLTQSTWSHAALYIGDVLTLRDPQGAPLCFVEADLNEGVRAVPLSEFANHHCRICRPVQLRERDAAAVVSFAISRIGIKYDLKNVFDLARYLFPTPPVPTAWRRRMIAFGSGDPTRAICSTLIAQAFQAIRYPILPSVDVISAASPDCPECVEEVLHIRHHSLFVPRDFDISPYFQVVKPTLQDGFEYRKLHWRTDAEVAN